MTFSMTLFKSNKENIYAIKITFHGAFLNIGRKILNK